MFPEDFVAGHLDRSEPGDWVFDPFSGRGTTVFESLRHYRKAAGCDVNPVAVCLSNAKANAPAEEDVVQRIAELSALDPQRGPEHEDEFFTACFHERTLSQLLVLRERLRWRTDSVDCFIAAMALGCLHGESHRSKRYFSNRMPRTISTKPAYSVRWWAERGLCPPPRDIFSILANETSFRFASPAPVFKGVVKYCDARDASAEFPNLEGKIGLIVTSPPYLDVTDFEEDQWLRLWLLGGSMRPQRRGDTDHRHRDEGKYWRFLTESWAGCSKLLSESATFVVRIGGRIEPQIALEGLEGSLANGLNCSVELVESSVSDIAGGQLRVHAPKAKGTRREFDFVFRVEA